MGLREVQFACARLGKVRLSLLESRVVRVLFPEPVGARLFFFF